MTDFNIDFKIKITSDLQKELNKALSTTKKVNNSLKKTKSSFRSLLPTIRQINQRFGNLRFTIQNIQFLLLAFGAVRFGKAIVNESIRVQNSLIGLQSVAKNLNKDVRKMTGAAKELSADGLIPLADVSRSLKNLLAAGLDADQAIKLFKALRDAAAFNRQGQLSLADAVARSTDGFKNQLSILVDNAGITKNLSILQREYAKSIGTSVGKLTEAQKTTANYVGILREAKVFQGDYNKLLNTFSGALSEVGGRFNFLKAALGDTITQSEGSVRLLKELAKIFKTLEDTVKENSKAIGEVFLNSIITAGIAASLLAKGLLKIVSVLLRIRNFVNANQIEKLTTQINTLNKAIDKPGGRLTPSLLRSQGLKNIEEAIKKVSELNKLVEGKQFELVNFQKEIKAIELIGQAITKIQNKAVSLFGQPGGGPISTAAAAGSGTARTQQESFFNGLFLSFKKALVDTEVVKNLGKILGGTGKEGALATINSFIESIPQMGPILSEVFGFLTQGPEATRAFVREFAASVPIIIEALIDSIPVLIEELIAAIPQIAVALAGMLLDPSFWKRFLLNVGAAFINGGKRFIEEIIKGAAKFVKALIDSITNVGGVLGTGSAGTTLTRVGTAISTGGLSEVAKVFGFNKGGQYGKTLNFANAGEVPSGSPSDGFLSRLQSGELVITRETNRKLDQFLDTQIGGGGAPQVIQVKSEINERTLIDTIVRLQRTGQI